MRTVMAVGDRVRWTGREGVVEEVSFNAHGLSQARVRFEATLSGTADVITLPVSMLTPHRAPVAPPPKPKPANPDAMLPESIDCPVCASATTFDPDDEESVETAAARPRMQAKRTGDSYVCPDAHRVHLSYARGLLGIPDPKSAPAAAKHPARPQAVVIIKHGANVRTQLHGKLAKLVERFNGPTFNGNDGKRWVARLEHTGEELTIHEESFDLVENLP
jgi:hypothetical protein